jgi:hypothetical protein
VGLNHARTKISWAGGPRVVCREDILACPVGSACARADSNMGMWFLLVHRRVRSGFRLGCQDDGDVVEQANDFRMASWFSEWRADERDT